MQKTKWILFLGFLISVLSIPIFSCPVLATDYYVDVNTGDDTYAGTSWSAPFKTINQAKSISQPGDHIRVNHGVYKEEIGGLVSGTEGAPIIYEGIGNVVIDGEGIRSYGFNLYNSDRRYYITIKNFHITRTRNSAIRTRGCSHITIDNCRITNCGHLDKNWAVMFDWVSANYYYPAFITFTNNVLDNNYHGLFLRCGPRCKIDKNTIVNTLGMGLQYYNDGNNARGNIITNNLICDSTDFGLVLDNFTSGSDQVLKNNVWNNGSNWRVSGVTSETWGDNLNIDPLFVSGTWFLSPDSPMITVGTVDESVGRYKTIGALAVGEISSGTIDSWSGWVDENGSSVSVSSLVELDANGNIQPKIGVTQAGLYSPVLSCPDAAHLRAIRIDALQALGVSAGEKQLIDADNTTITPEIRYRYSNTGFSQTAAAPEWISTNPNQPLEVKGKYFQIELVMRIDGI